MASSTLPGRAVPTTWATSTRARPKHGSNEPCRTHVPSGPFATPTWCLFFFKQMRYFKESWVGDKKKTAFYSIFFMKVNIMFFTIFSISKTNARLGEILFTHDRLLLIPRLLFTPTSYFETSSICFICPKIFSNLTLFLFYFRLSQLNLKIFKFFSETYSARLPLSSLTASSPSPLLRD